MNFDRNLLPPPLDYFNAEGFKVQRGRTWRTMRCPFHGGSDSMRINTENGAWVCMACGAKGGDVLAFHMHHHGLTFLEAARDLGALSARSAGNSKPLPFSARDALLVLRFEALLCAIAACNLGQGIVLTELDRARLVTAAGRINFICDRVAE